MVKPAIRQHFIARFYLRNFAEPMFSDNLWVYDIQRRRWERRTPNGLGWFPHLCSVIDMHGHRTAGFDAFLKLHVEDPAAPAMRKLATGETINARERAAVALFIALTAARPPKFMRAVVGAHLNSLTRTDRAELDALVKLWCKWTRRPYDSNAHAEFLKPSTFGAIWVWSRSLQRRLLQWGWNLVRASRDQPFVTTDRPVLGQWDRRQNVRVVTFPVSSEVALVIVSDAQFNNARDRSVEAYTMNRGTMQQATEFVVACRNDFPGNEYLVEPTRA